MSGRKVDRMLLLAVCVFLRFNMADAAQLFTAHNKWRERERRAAAAAAADGADARKYEYGSNGITYATAFVCVRLRAR